VGVEEEKSETKHSVCYKEKGKKLIQKCTRYLQSESHYKNSEILACLFLSFTDLPPKPSLQVRIRSCKPGLDSFKVLDRILYRIYMDRKTLNGHMAIIH